MANFNKMRQLRLKNDYREMCNIRGDTIEWRAQRGQPPYVEQYVVTARVRSIVGPAPSYREVHKIDIALPPSYPNALPITKMLSRPVVFHPNWWSDGKWCHGQRASGIEGLGHYVIRMVQTLQFDRLITYPASAANGSARDWYLKNLDSALFPCDHKDLPDPTTSRFDRDDAARRDKNFQIHME